MATNKRISALDNLGATPAVGDILPITDVDDTTGSLQGTTKGVTVANLMGASPVQSVAGRTGAVSIASTDVSGLGTAATTNASAYATAAQGILAGSAVQPTDSIDILADVDTSTVAPTTTDFLKWGGSNWVPAVPTADVNTPLTTALRGTDNPHIGAYPNQSFKVTDNPAKSVMVIADADGNLEFVTKDGANVFVNTPSSRLALAKGFSIQADGAEPDIEAVDTDGTTYSVISGDTDTKGPNGLPTRQGFNYPDIGANPAPILISGGSIA